MLFFGLNIVVRIVVLNVKNTCAIIPEMLYLPIRARKNVVILMFDKNSLQIVIPTNEEIMIARDTVRIAGL